MNSTAEIIEEPLVDRTRQLIADAYLADARPWVVAYSGGKDSTLVLQLVVEVLIELGDQATKPVHIISSDTQVEAPNVAEYVKSSLNAIETAAEKMNLPISTKLVQPEIPNTFWCKLIGRGYPPPTRWFRWCTTNMKIKPSRRAIDDIVSTSGSVVLLLGTRLSESANRKRAMLRRVNNSRDLNPHHEIPNAFVFTPISEWEDDEVWEYLFENNPSPWGKSHDRMLALYRSAAGGECPVVIDLNTPSCGGSRFGCWTCTVVKMDKSMNGFIGTGEAWMQPLADFRNWLKEYRERDDVRMKRRRDGTDRPGPFTPEARCEILQYLLKVETQVEMRLISDSELTYIHSVWVSEFDLEGRVNEIARRFGRSIQEDETMPLADDEKSALEEIVATHGLNPLLVRRILDLEKDFPNLDRWGERPRLKQSLSELISVAETQVETSE